MIYNVFTRVYTYNKGEQWLEFEWDDHNIEHIAEHAVEPYEAEEVFDDVNRCPVDAHSGRRGLMGMTENGRLIVVIYEIRGGLIRVCTAREPSNGEKRVYKRRRR